MNLRRLHCFAGLAWDAAEALLYSINSNRVADVLWASARTDAAHRLVEKEAGEEVADPECSCPEWGNPNWPHRHSCPVPEPKCWCGNPNCSTWPPADDPKTSAGGEAPNLPADAPQHSTSSPTAAGQPNLPYTIADPSMKCPGCGSLLQVSTTFYYPQTFPTAEQPIYLTADAADIASWVLRRYAEKHPALPYDICAIADKLDPATRSETTP